MTRLFVAFATAVVGQFIVFHTLGQVMLWNDDPIRAQHLAPWDGRNTAALAEALAIPAAANTAHADGVARTALLQDPTAVAAAATLAMNAKIAGLAPQSDRLFAYAERLSRRNFATQLWAIENAVARGDVSGALHHYDVALRTKPKAYDLLFPVLANALDEPAIRTALVKTLAQRPSWTASFLDFVSTAGGDSLATAQLFIDLRRAGVPIAQGAQARLVSALIAHKLYAEAWKAYTAGQPGTDPERSRDPAFIMSIASEAPTLFDWVLARGAGISAAIQRAGTGGSLVFSTSANVAGDLVQQAQLLRPGAYRLFGRSTGLNQPEASRPYWVLRCHSDGRELGRVVLSNSVQNGGSFVGVISVPPGCPLQMLALVAQPTDSISGVSGQIERVQLVPSEK